MSGTDLTQQLAEEQWIRAYFLGDLPEVEEDRIQERLFTDPDFFESLLMVEGELVDDYALDLISDREREKLENGFLMNPYQYRRVQLVRTLNRYIANNRAVPAGLRKSAPSLFTQLRSTFLKSAPPSVRKIKSEASQNRVRSIDDGRRVREGILREAADNRKFLQCLIASDWLGLELLLQLRTVSQVSQTDLAALAERDGASLTAALSLLIDAGLVDETAGKYACSSFASRILKNIDGLTGHDLI